MKFEYYEDEKGYVPFEEFLEKLSPKDKSKLLWIIEATEALGLEIAKKQQWVKKLEDNLFELRSIQGSNIQRGLYFHFKNNKYIITHGFTKKTDKTPEAEKFRAKKIRNIFEKNHDKERDDGY